MYKITPLVCWETINEKPCNKDAQYQMVNDLGKIYVCEDHVVFYNPHPMVNKITALSELIEKDEDLDKFLANGNHKN